MNLVIAGKRFRVSSGYGEKRRYKIANVWHEDVHDGLDLVPQDEPAMGTALPSPVAGRVIRTGQPGSNKPDSTGALYVAIDMGKKTSMWFFHLSRYAVKVGQFIQVGDILGYTGQTGKVTGPHTHVEVRIGTTKVDPHPYLERATRKPPKNVPPQQATAVVEQPIVQQEVTAPTTHAPATTPLRRPWWRVFTFLLNIFRRRS